MSGFVDTELFKFTPHSEITAALTPPASWYTKDDFYEAEVDSVFKKNWIYLGLNTKLKNPGDYLTDEIAGIPYILSRDSFGQIVGLLNVCSHHGTCVAKGQGNQTEFQCPYHGWTYSLNGELLRSPMAGNMGEQWKGKLNLKGFKILEWGDFLFGNLSAEPSSFDVIDSELSRRLDELGSLKLKHIETRSYEIDCNWKIFVDNYLDGGYHVPSMHPKLSEGINFKSYRSEIFDRYSIQTCDSHTNERLGGGSLYAWVYPNFMLNRYGPWLDVNWVKPLGANKCEVVFEYFYEGELAAGDRDQAFKESDLVQQEDMEVCLMVQKGLKSGYYSQGPYAARFEKPMLHFHNLLHSDLNTYTKTENL